MLYPLMKQYSEFQSKEEFNTYIDKVLTRFHAYINKTDFSVLRFLSRYAVNEKKQTIGVACPLMKTISEKLEKSIRTVRRSVSKLEEIGIIKRVLTKERYKRGGYSANLYVFQKGVLDRMGDRMEMTVCEKEENAEVCRSEGEFVERETSFSKTACNILHKQSTYKLDETYCRHDIPESFIHAIVPMTRNPETINFVWGKVELAYQKSGLFEQGIFFEQLLADEEIQMQMIRRTKSVVRAHKHGEIKKDIGALLYGTMYALFLDTSLEYGAAQRRSSGITLFDPFKKEPCAIHMTLNRTFVQRERELLQKERRQ